jgi:hypothetical protein
VTYLVALASGGWILVLVALLLLAGVIYGFYTRASGIEQHPVDSRGQSPGAEGPSEVSARDEGEGSALDTHGTR